MLFGDVTCSIWIKKILKHDIKSRKRYEVHEKPKEQIEDMYLWKCDI